MYANGLSTITVVYLTRVLCRARHWRLSLIYGKASFKLQVDILRSNGEKDATCRKTSSAVWNDVIRGAFQKLLRALKS